MKNKDLVKFQEGLNSVQDLKGVKFAFAVVRNQKKVAAALEDVRAAYKQDPLYQVYEQKRVELASEYAEKNEDNSPKVVNNQFVLSNVEEFQEKFLELQDEYAETIRNQMNIEDEFKDLLEQEADIELSKVSSQHLPEDLSASQIEAIFEMISED